MITSNLSDFFWVQNHENGFWPSILYPMFVEKTSQMIKTPLFSCHLNFPFLSISVISII